LNLRPLQIKREGAPVKKIKVGSGIETWSKKRGWFLGGEGNEFSALEKMDNIFREPLFL